VYADARQLSENLNQAMHSRVTIDYAIGILMAPWLPESRSGFQAARAGIAARKPQDPRDR
jgi:hypothetical protein